MTLAILPVYSTLNTTTKIAPTSIFSHVPGGYASGEVHRVPAVSLRRGKAIIGTSALNNAATILWSIPKMLLPSGNAKTTLTKRPC